jgi:hypothetical protein
MFFSEIQTFRSLSVDYFKLKQRGMQNAKWFRALRKTPNKRHAQSKAVVTGARFCTRWRHEPNQTPKQQLFRASASLSRWPAYMHAYDPSSMQGHLYFLL